MSVSAGVGEDNFDDSYFGLQESTFRTAAALVRISASRSAGAWACKLQRYAGLSGRAPRVPGRNEFAARLDSKNMLITSQIYATPPRFGRNTEARVSYRLQPRRGQLLYTMTFPGDPCPTTPRSFQMS